jgi:hypothetical protein
LEQKVIALFARSGAKRLPHLSQPHSFQVSIKRPLKSEGRPEAPLNEIHWRDNRRSGRPAFDYAQGRPLLWCCRHAVGDASEDVTFGRGAAFRKLPQTINRSLYAFGVHPRRQRDEQSA